MTRIAIPKFLLLTCLLALIEMQAPRSQSAAEPEDEGLKQDYKAVEGTWERTIKDAAGNMLRGVKAERAGKSTVTYFDSNGLAIYQHTSEYELKRQGSARIFRYRNKTITKGEQQGLVQKEPREYLYRIAGDEFVEIHGMLVGQERERVQVLVWKRVKEDEA
jgi:hypothetical protein